METEIRNKDMDQQNQTPEQVDESTDGVSASTPMATIVLLLVAVLAGATGYFHADPTREQQRAQADIAVARAQAEATVELARSNMNIANVKRSSDLQKAVIENCVNQKRTPVFKDGNIDCKP